MTRLTNLIKEVLRTPLHELEERFKVIDTKTGEVIDNDLPKRIAQKLAAKKKEWYPYPDKKESTIAKIARTLDESKKKDCNCGCNTCENVGNEGVLLNESKAPKQILSENLQYHVHNKLPLTENTFRYGSNSFINLWAEARALYLREIIHVNDDDKEILTETDLGNYGIYEGKKIPLDLPMLNENVSIETLKDEFEREFNVRTSLIGNQKLIILDKGVLYKFDEMVEFIESNGFKVNTDLSNIEYEIDDDRARYPFIIFSKELMNESEDLDWEDDWEEEDDWEDDDNIYTGPYSYGIDRRTWDGDGEGLYRLEAIRKMLKKYPKELAKLESNPQYPALDMTYGELIKWYKSISNFSLSEAANKGLEQKLNSELGDINGIFAQEDIDVDDAEFYNVKPGNYIKYYIEDVNNSTILKVKRIAKANGLKFAKDLDDMLLFTSTSINEAAKKKKKKDPPIGKPKRGGSKAYYVYVRDPRTKKVKKISFGSGGLKAKINNPKARKAFAARHKCSTKTDKTKAGYWSCRLPRYAKLLGLKSSFSGFW